MAQFELVETVTKDGLVHQGMFARPEPHSVPHSGTSRGRALLWVHGLTGRFYGDVKTMNLFADECTKQGMAFASFNTRGHDIISSMRKIDPKEPNGYTHVTIGASSEVFEESVFDIDAGISYLADQGFDQVILAGHSTGANKVCYYAGNTNDPRVAGVVLAGPMSDRLSEHTDKKQYDKNLTMLRELIETGRGDALLAKTHWFPITAKRAWSLLSPNTHEDVFNYGDEKNVLVDFNKITSPVMVVLAGNDDVADRPAETIQKVFDAHTGSKNYRSVIIPDATHQYSGKQQEFVHSVVSWAKSL